MAWLLRRRRKTFLCLVLCSIITVPALFNLWSGHDEDSQAPRSLQKVTSSDRKVGMRGLGNKHPAGHQQGSHNTSVRVLEGISRYDRVKDFVWSHRDNRWLRWPVGNKHPLTGDTGDHKNGVVNIQPLRRDEVSNMSHNNHPHHIDQHHSQTHAEDFTTSESKTKFLQRVCAWPTPRDVDYKLPTDPEASWFTIEDRGRSYKVGDTVKVKIQAVNSKGLQKTFGGDFWRAKIQTVENRTSAVGTVKDNENGTYTANLRLLWPGEVTIAIMLVHPSEAVSVLRKLREDHPLLLRFRNKFRSGADEQEVTCNIKMDQSAQSLCNYSNVQHGVSWYCEKPVGMSCEDRVSHIFLPGNFPNVSADEARLLDENGTFYKRIIKPHPDGSDKIFVEDIERDDIKKCVKTLHYPRMLCAAQLPGRAPCKPGVPLRTPAGFYFKDIYISTMCDNQQYNLPLGWMKCLAGKTLQIIGDSTARQLYYFLKANLPLKDITRKGVEPKFGPLHLQHKNKDINIKFNFHSYPARTFHWVNVEDIVDEVDVINSLDGGPNVVLVISIWSHFVQTYLSVYLDRMLAVREAVLRLLAKSPGTIVVLKSANTRWDPVITTSDWYAWQLDRVQRELFRGVPVGWLDAWDMTAAADHPESIHPAPPVVHQEIQMILSYICQ